MTIERRHDESFGMPSPEALELASEVIRRYIRPETIQHPQVRSESLRVHDSGVRARGVALGATLSLPDRPSMSGGLGAGVLLR